MTHYKERDEGLPRVTAGAPSKSWLGTDSCGDPLLLPCVPVGMTDSEGQIFSPDNDGGYIEMPNNIFIVYLIQF